MNERSLAAAIDGRMFPADAPPRGLVDAAIEQGVAGLLADSPASATLDAEERGRLAEHLRADAVRLAAFDAELMRVLEALARARVTPLLLKGVHLAHAVYPKPWLRPRSDTDLLIEASDRSRFAAAIERCGYVPAVHVRGRVILGQFHFERISGSGLAHYLDVHWRVAAPLLMERVLPAARFFASARTLPSLGPHARVPDLPHALLLACVHFAAHHRSDPRLVWLHDLRLIAEALDEQRRDAFVELASSTDCCAIADCALSASLRVFDSAALDHLAARIRSRMPRREASAAILWVKRPAGALWLDLRSASWRDRASLVREHLLPDRAYMSHRRGPLPLAYAMRVAGGLKRWLTRVSGADRTVGSGG